MRESERENDVKKKKKLRGGSVDFPVRGKSPGAKRNNYIKININGQEGRSGAEGITFENRCWRLQIAVHREMKVTKRRTEERNVRSIPQERGVTRVRGGYKLRDSSLGRVAPYNS